MIYFDCPYCDQMLAIEESDLGTDILCANCQDVISIPISRLSPGFILYDFVLKRKLATWEKGKVYLAWQLSLEREVVVKILDPDYNDRETVEEFAGEAKQDAQMGVSHAGQVFFLGELSGLYFYVMENYENIDQCNTAVFTRQVVISDTESFSEQFSISDLQVEAEPAAPVPIKLTASNVDFRDQMDYDAPEETYEEFPAAPEAFEPAYEEISAPVEDLTPVEEPPAAPGKQFSMPGGAVETRKKITAKKPTKTQFNIQKKKKMKLRR